MCVTFYVQMHPCAYAIGAQRPMVVYDLFSIYVRQKVSHDTWCLLLQLDWPQAFFCSHSSALPLQVRAAVPRFFFFNMGQTQHMESTLPSHLHGATFLAFCDRYSKTWSLSRTLRNLNSWSSKVQATPPDQVVSSQNGCGSYPWLGHTCPSLNQAQCLPQEGRKKGGGTLS